MEPECDRGGGWVWNKIVGGEWSQNGIRGLMELRWDRGDGWSWDVMNGARVESRERMELGQDQGGG